MNSPKHSEALRVAVVGTLALINPAAAATIHVSLAGDDGNDGLSWAMAKPTVQAGLSAAQSGDQVWVAAGTYVGNITLKLGVALYGGLAGDEDPATFDLTDRNFLAHPTILDGNQAGSVVTSPSGATTTTRIDGFTIRNGSGTLIDSYRSGGGIFCQSSSPTIANNTVKGNSVSGSGGGIYCFASSSPVVVANTIAANIASIYGGGVCCVSPSSPIIADNAITGNKASTGGGIYWSNSSPKIANNTITTNTANSGGGTYCLNPASVTIANTIIAFNSSGVYSLPGLTLRHNCVYGNTTNYVLISDPTGTNGNISADPLFVRVPSDGGDGWGDNPNTPEVNEGANDDYGDLRLRVGSPCIDAGNNAAVPADVLDLDGDGNTTEPLSVDLGGRKRFVNDPATPDTGAGTAPIVDIGAWEHLLARTPDFDGDGDVDQVDFAHLQACLFGGDSVEPACADADFSGYAPVDQDEVVVFAACASGPGIGADPVCLER